MDQNRILYLAAKDVERAGVDMKRIIDAIETVYRQKGQGDVEMPSKIGVHTRPNALIHAMPAYMAAPAALPEFKGNVTNVLTEQYWDMEVVELRIREKTIKPKVDELNNQVKAGTLTREAGKAAADKHYAETFTPRELQILQKSTSNFDFHYMGSAKIMAQIGKGFAEAMVAMLK